MDRNKLLKNLIDTTIRDTKYVLDDARPIRGIYKTLCIWFLFYTGSTLVLLFTDSIVPMFFFKQGINALSLNQFFSMKRTITLVLFSTVIISYLISVFKIKMSLKEKDFLKLFSVFIVLYSLSRMIYPIAYYINPNILMNFNNALPLDLVVNVIAMILLVNYIKDKRFYGIILINSLYLVLNFVSSILSNNGLSDSALIAGVNSIISYMNSNGIIVILSFLITFILIKDVRYEA